MADVSALVLEGPRSLSVRRFPRPALREDSALLRVELVGICGTDIKTYAGAMPYPFPLVLGHEIVGRIDEAGERFLQEKAVSVGDRVYVAARVPCWSCAPCQAGDARGCLNPCGYGTWTPADREPNLWGGMAQYMYLAPGSVIRRAPDAVSPEAALMAQTVVANGFEWVRIAGGAMPGGTVVIQGCGPQGLGAAVVAIADGAALVVVTGLASDARRLEFARRAGAITIDVETEDPIDAVHRLTDGRMSDVVVNVTGSPSTVAESMRLARNRGTIALAGLSGKGIEASLPIDEIVWRELTIRGCFSKGMEATELATQFVERGETWVPFLHDLVTDVVGLDGVEQVLRAPVAGTAGQADHNRCPVKIAVDPWLNLAS